MRIYKHLLPLIFLLLTATGSAQSVNISGSGSGYQNAGVRFYSQTDPVSKRLKPILTVLCDEKGFFSAEVPCRKTDVIFIKVGTFIFHLYVTDSSKYVLLLPNNIAKSGNEELNPFFIETDIIPVLVNKSDVNTLIGKFDSEYNPVFNFVADRVFRNNRNEDLQKEISKLEKFKEIPGISFYNDYVKFRMIMLNQLLSTGKNGQINEEEHLNKFFNSANTACLELVEQMFSGYFNKISSGTLMSSFNNAIGTASYKELKSVTCSDGKITNPELADFVILLNLNRSYFEQNLPGDNIRKIISLMRTQGETIFIRDIASTLLNKINSTLPGNYPAGFSLASTDGKLVSLKDFYGKYLILGFARSDSPASLTELGIINMWYKKYIRDVQVVIILADKEFKPASDALKKRGFNWIYLDGSKKEMIEFDYDLKMYPAFILLNREGKIIASPCSYPSENLEPEIRKILLADPARSGTENR
jgi:hypothetical protein